MIKVFKKVDGTIVNPITHTRTIVASNPDIKVYIGTDSQTHRRMTVYATVIAYRYGHRGVHYITQKQVVPKIKNLWDRLLKETELSIECAQFLSENGLDRFITAIDMDFNDEEEFESNRLVAASVGWAKGLGYNVRVKKPNSSLDENVLIATKAADHQVRHLSNKESRKANRRLKRKTGKKVNKKVGDHIAAKHRPIDYSKYKLSDYEAVDTRTNDEKVTQAGFDLKTSFRKKKKNKK